MTGPVAVPDASASKPRRLDDPWAQQMEGQVADPKKAHPHPEALIADCDRLAGDLDQEDEENRVRIHNPANSAYSTYARAAALKRDNLRRSADELRVHCQSQRKYITLKFSEFEHASDAVHEDGVTRGLITKHLGGTIAIFVLAHDLTPLSSIPAMAILIEASAARGAVSRGRKFGEHHCRALASAFVVVHFADCFARRLHCQLADLALGLPRCLTFLPREGKAAGHSLSAVDDPSVPGAEQRVPIW